MIDLRFASRDLLEELYKIFRYDFRFRYIESWEQLNEPALAALKRTIEYILVHNHSFREQSPAIDMYERAFLEFLRDEKKVFDFPFDYMLVARARSAIGKLYEGFRVQYPNVENFQYLEKHNSIYWDLVSYIRDKLVENFRLPREDPEHAITFYAFINYLTQLHKFTDHPEPPSVLPEAPLPYNPPPIKRYTLAIDPLPLTAEDGRLKTNVVKEILPKNTYTINEIPEFSKEVINEIIEKYKKYGNWDVVACDYGDNSLSVISSVADSIGIRQYHELVRKYSQDPIEREETDVSLEDESLGGVSDGLQKIMFLHGQSFSDTVRPAETSVFVNDKKIEIPQVQRIRIPFSNRLSEICQLAKKLRSRAIFLGRQLYFLRTNKKNYNLAKQYPKEAKQILEFIELRVKQKKESIQFYEELKHKLYVDPSLRIDLKSTTFEKLKMFEFSGNLYNFLKKEDSFQKLDDIYSQLPTQVLRNVASDWKAFNKSHISWYYNPDLFEGEPRIPSKNRKTNEFLLTFPGAFVNNKKYASTIVDRFINTKKPTRNSKRLRNQLSKYCSSGELTLPQKFLNNFPSSDPFPTVRTTIDIGSIIEVKIVPKKVYFEVQVVYAAQKSEGLLLVPERAYSIDIGVNNSIGLTNNFGEQSILVRGKLIKSVNQWMNKRIGDLRSVQTQEITFKKGDSLPESPEMTRIRRKRDAIIDDYFHKVSRFVINRCLKDKVKYLSIGYNAGWKKELTSTENKKMRHEDRQTFAHIPFLKLIEMIKYKADLVGITVVRIGESHTSKCSAVDFEPIEHHETYLGQRGISLKGKNKKKEIEAGESEYKHYKTRGLFRTKDGHLIHSDINASYNIGRRAFPELFNERTLNVKNMLRSPCVICVYKHVKSTKKKRYVKRSCVMV